MSLRFTAGMVLTVLLGDASRAADAPAAERPSIVVIITDDQGFGDLGCHGNPDLKTPHLDRFARESAWLKQFYVSPVCAPTRAALLTGRYNYRTGVTDTYLGRALMRPREVTLAEVLAAAGYRTGIFGKWHLGDNSPLRPMDQGFQESLVLKGGGIGQPSDPPGGESYFDPLLLHNGRLEKSRGYCSDVFTDAAIRFIESSGERPFFVYLAFNAPHTPLEVPEAAVAPYRTGKLSPGPHPIDGPLDQDATARVYGMVSNIDSGLGRLFARLDDLKRSENTIVVFLTDNGPQQPRYVGGLRGRKGSVYDGGVRVPCYIRWPRVLAAGRVVDRVAAHIDLMPTLLEAAGLPRGPAPIDGRSLLPLLRADVSDWPDRTLFVQWHRGDEPQRYRAFAARTQRWKLVQAKGAAPGEFDANSPLELFDMEADAFETKDVAGEHPDVVARLRGEYDAWFRDVTAEGFAPPRIHLGSAAEDPVMLTRQDWRGPRAGWSAGDVGQWEVEIVEPGTYEMTARVAKGPAAEAALELAGKTVHQAVAAEDAHVKFPAIKLPAGPATLRVQVGTGATVRGPLSIDVRHVSP